MRALHLILMACILGTPACSSSSSGGASGASSGGASGASSGGPGGASSGGAGGASSGGMGGGKTPADALTIAWAPNAAVAANGTAPKLDAATVCGSSTATFLSELQNTSPANAKVQKEWADAVPGGKQVAIAGVVKTTHLGPQDLPMSHELGDDLSMNVLLDKEFLPFTQNLGQVMGEQGTNEMHVEISSGYIPHVPSAASPDTGQTWAQMADKNLQNFQSGFDIPPLGDRILIRGRWIVDCGHNDYSTELHAMSFLAWAHTDAKTTTVRVYDNGYRDSEEYNPDFTILGKTGDASRFSQSTTKTFPLYLQDEVIRLLAGQTSRLRSYGLIDSETSSPVDWVACAPAGTSGSTLQVHYDFVTRKDVTVTATPDTAKGCVTMHTVLGAGYQPADIKLRHCDLPWTYLNQIAGAAVGDPTLDIKQIILNSIGQQNASKLNQDPEAACGDALAGPPISTTPNGQTVRVDNTQPFPFYGVVTVAWSG